jgi:hypothetical protein
MDFMQAKMTLRNTLVAAIMLFHVSNSYCQNLNLASEDNEVSKSSDIVGKRFHQVDNIPNSDTYLNFSSTTKALYIITGTLPFSGKSFRDECPCSVSISNDVISINCMCQDREIYPDPIRDSFTFDAKRQVLISKSHRYNGNYMTWKLN